MANVKATDLIDFTRASKGHALAKVSYGDELVENGDFSANSDWTKGSGWTISGGLLRATNASNYSVTYQSLTTIVGRVYEATVETVSYTSGAFRLYTNDGTSSHEYVDINDVGTHTVRWVARTTSDNIRFYCFDASNPDTATFDNISVKEVLFNQPDGTLQLFEHPNNIPRIEYDADGNLLGLLIEEARTNLVSDSQDFVTDYNKVNINYDVDSLEAPDGTTTATKLIARSISGQHRIDRPSTYSAGTYTFSVFVKEGGLGFVELRFGADRAVFNIEDGSTSSVGGGITTHYKDMGNGWKRVAITHSAETNNTLRINVRESASTNSFIGDDVSGIYVWGAQLEAGSFPTSYIKTTGSTASRSADVASIDVDQFGYNQSEGTVTVEIDSLTDTLVGNPMAYQLNDGTTSERLTVFGSSSSWRFVATDGGVQQSSITGGTFGTAKIASSFEQNKFNHCVNGALSTEDTSGTMPTITELGLGHQNGGNLLNGHIKSLTYTPKRLSNAKLQELTS